MDLFLTGFGVYQVLGSRFALTGAGMIQEPIEKSIGTGSPIVSIFTKISPGSNKKRRGTGKDLRAFQTDDNGNRSHRLAIW